MSPRTDFERQALEPFAGVAEEFGISTFRGQGAANRIAVAGNAYFQFGDLRVDLPRCHLVVEVESAGGLTNLVKYWHCIERGLIKRPVWLLHLFRQASPDDYRSHLELWDFLASEMSRALGDRFRAELFTYGRDGTAPALAVFERWLREGTSPA